MEAVEGAGVSVTIIDIVKQLSRLFHEGEPKWAFIPEKEKYIAELFFQFTLERVLNVLLRLRQRHPGVRQEPFLPLCLLALRDVVKVDGDSPLGGLDVGVQPHAEARGIRLHRPARAVRHGGTQRLVSDLVAQQARVFCVGTDAPGAIELPTRTADPLLEPVLQIQAFYRLVNALAIRRGYDPDQPVNLSKVTETL